jgi:hypothetical protein
MHTGAEALEQRARRRPPPVSRTPGAAGLRWRRRCRPGLEFTWTLSFLLLCLVQSCALLAGSDGLRPPQAARSTAPAAAGSHGRGRCVARLRGGGGDGDWDGEKEAAASGAPAAARSWADLVRQSPQARTPSVQSRTPSVNVAAGNSPLPAGLGPEGEGAVHGERIPMEMLADLDLDAAVADDGTDIEPGGVTHVMPFMTDAEIRDAAAKQQGPGSRAGQDRELEPFRCDEEPGQFEGGLEDDAEVQLDSASKRVKDFDQFKLNEEKFGIRADDWKEEEYTAPIDKSDPAYPEQVKRAEQLAAEIEGSWAVGGATTMRNMHVRDERNLPLPADLDEATLYSTVHPVRPDDPVAAQLMHDQAPPYPAAVPASSAAPPWAADAAAGGASEAEEEEEEMNSEEVEALLADAEARFKKMIDNNEPLPPEVQAVVDSIQVSVPSFGVWG